MDALGLVSLIRNPLSQCKVRFLSERAREAETCYIRQTAQLARDVSTKNTSVVPPGGIRDGSVPAVLLYFTFKSNLLPISLSIDTKRQR
jgi:hypothetical protein